MEITRRVRDCPYIMDAVVKGKDIYFTVAREVIYIAENGERKETYGQIYEN